MQSVETIGPAVFNGGVTTFLALVLLGASTSHTFLTFFKVKFHHIRFLCFYLRLQVFVLTVVFGLFHGLLLLPVILSWVGPVGQQDGDHDSDSENSENTINSDDTNVTIDGDDNTGLDNRAFQTVTKHSSMDHSWTVTVTGLGRRGSWSPGSDIV